MSFLSVLSRWMAYVRKHMEHPLSYDLLFDLLGDLNRLWEAESICREEVWISKNILFVVVARSDVLNERIKVDAMFVLPFRILLVCVSPYPIMFVYRRNCICYFKSNMSTQLHPISIFLRTLTKLALYGIFTSTNKEHPVSLYIFNLNGLFVRRKTPVRYCVYSQTMQ
jgi:hypothetical protein